MKNPLIKLKNILITFKLWLVLLPRMLREPSIIGSGSITFIGDGFLTTRPYGGFDSDFEDAFYKTFAPPVPINMSRFKYVIWRAHIYSWALNNSLGLRGDCVELGVWWGMLPYTALKTTNIKDKVFHLVDAFGLQPPSTVNESLWIRQEKYGNDIFEEVQKKFTGLPVRFHRGYVPEILEADGFPNEICFLSMDLNNHIAERAGIERLWEKIVIGGYIYIDDYGCQGYKNTRTFYDEFFKGKHCLILKTPYSSALVQKVKN